mmetsp:Transcript_24975/g.61808  ORF Transcript_24975/g.61808 Transcript_24975/m.61808 type:complete len:219 (-) Transcript_24975:368-1024(-)
MRSLVDRSRQVCAPDDRHGRDEEHPQIHRDKGIVDDSRQGPYRVLHLHHRHIFRLEQLGGLVDGIGDTLGDRPQREGGLGVTVAPQNPTRTGNTHADQLVGVIRDAVHYRGEDSLVDPHGCDGLAHLGQPFHPGLPYQPLRYEEPEVQNGTHVQPAHQAVDEQPFQVQWLRLPALALGLSALDVLADGISQTRHKCRAPHLRHQWPKFQFSAVGPPDL